MYYIYLLTCIDGTLYCGITNDLEKRMKQHNGLLVGGAKYTKGRTPVTLVYTENYETKSEALRREAAIKKLSKKQKTMLISQNPS